MIEDNEYVGLSPLTLEDIRNFFNTYIKPFLPYKEGKVYDTFINNLTEYYYNQLYLNVPSELKQIYEEANFDVPSIYNKLLIAIGVPEVVIDNLSAVSKIIFLKTLSDFERYKGTVSFFQKVADAFGDRLSIYELFIDYDVATTSWVFKPEMIYLHGNMVLNTTPIPYETIRSAVPSLLLSEEQLQTMYNDEKLILPIKSNLLLLDSDLVTEVSVLYDVIVAIFLHTYKEQYIDIYFTDDYLQTVQLKTLYFLWFYLLTEYYDVSWTAFASKVLLKFVYSDIGFPPFIGTIPTTIDNLYQIIDRYDNIKVTNTPVRDYDNSQSLRDSLYKDISEAFYTVAADAAAITATDMYNSLVSTNALLINYINTRISSTTSIGKKAEINLILNEIYSSLLLHASMYSGDEYFTKYVDYFIRYLPQVLVNPENIPSYTILYNLKPYHVELYSTYNTGILSDDKFNAVYIDDETDLKFLYQIMFASVLSVSDDCFFNNVYSSESPMSILSSMNFQFLHIVEDVESTNIDDSKVFETKLSDVSVNVMSDDYLPSLEKISESEVIVRSAADNFSTLMGTEDVESLSEETPINYQQAITSTLNSSIDYLLLVDKDLMSNVSCIDSYTVIES